MVSTVMVAHKWWHSKACSLWVVAEM